MYSFRVDTDYCAEPSFTEVNTCGELTSDLFDWSSLIYKDHDGYRRKL
jgi:hypothetical protein